MSALPVVALPEAARTPGVWFAADGAPDRGDAMEAVATAERRAPIYSLAFYRKHTEKLLCR